jgi:hypothetical protein
MIPIRNKTTDDGRQVFSVGVCLGCVFVVGVIPYNWGILTLFYIFKSGNSGYEIAFTEIATH